MSATSSSLLARNAAVARRARVRLDGFVRMLQAGRRHTSAFSCELIQPFLALVGFALALVGAAMSHLTGSVA